MKIGASMVTAVAGGTTWLIVEPGMRDRVAQFTGLDLPGTEAAAPASTPEPLDLARHPDAAPSFNCDDATRTIEHLICSDPAIAEADVSLGRVWSTLKSRGLVDDELRMSQRQWLAKRDACLIDDDPKTCVKRSMLDRIGELSAL
ncbi:MAG: lysozyme inhibitor LprI family protein [Pseudomonadota bacterium]